MVNITNKRGYIPSLLLLRNSAKISTKTKKNKEYPQFGDINRSIKHILTYNLVSKGNPNQYCIETASKV